MLAFPRAQATAKSSAVEWGAISSGGEAALAVLSLWRNRFSHLRIFRGGTLMKIMCLA